MSSDTVTPRRTGEGDCNSMGDRGTGTVTPRGTGEEGR